MGISSSPFSMSEGYSTVSARLDSLDLAGGQAGDFLGLSVDFEKIVGYPFSSHDMSLAGSFSSVLFVWGLHHNFNF